MENYFFFVDFGLILLSFYFFVIFIIYLCVFKLDKMGIRIKVLVCFFEIKEFLKEGFDGVLEECFRDFVYIVFEIKN